MFRKKILSSVVAIALVTAGTVAASASSASASLCSGGAQKNVVKNNTITFTRASGSGSSVTGSTGVTLTISKATTFTVSGSITASRDISASTVVVSVKGSLGVTIGLSHSGTSTSSGAWKVPSTYKIGRLEIGTNKYAGTVTNYVENSNCVWVKTGTAALYNAPAKEWHFRTSKVS